MRKGELDALRMRIYGRQAILGMVKKRDTKVYALRTGQVEGRTIVRRVPRTRTLFPMRPP